jgi:hypothetical protein
MVKSKILLLFVFTLIFCAACASTATVESTLVNPAQIYQYYEIDASRNETNLRVYFRVQDLNGATIDLDAPARIEVDNQALKENVNTAFNGTIYTLAEKNYRPVREFVFTNADGKIYRNRIVFEPIEFAAGGGKEIVLRRGETNYIPLSRISNDSKDFFQIYLSNSGLNLPEGKGFNESIEPEFDQARNALIIDKDVLQRAKTNEAWLEMKVQHSVPLTEKTAAGGDCRIYYQAEKVRVRITN